MPSLLTVAWLICCRILTGESVGAARNVTHVKCRLYVRRAGESPAADIARIFMSGCCTLLFYWVGNFLWEMFGAILRDMVFAGGANDHRIPFFRRISSAPCSSCSPMQSLFHSALRVWLSSSSSSS